MISIMIHIETTFSILDIYIQCEYLLNLVRNKFISGEEIICTYKFIKGKIKRIIKRQEIEN